MLLTIMVDAHEDRDVGTADVAGAYLKTDMDDFMIIMKFTGQSVDILCATCPLHIPFVIIENGVKVLYVRLKKAIYGCVKCAMFLWYVLFHNTLKTMGFVLNPHNLSVANKMINNKPCTIVWYVDDTKWTPMLSCPSSATSRHTSEK